MKLSIIATSLLLISPTMLLAENDMGAPPQGSEMGSPQGQDGRMGPPPPQGQNDMLMGPPQGQDGRMGPPQGPGGRMGPPPQGQNDMNGMQMRPPQGQGGRMGPPGMRGGNCPPGGGQMGPQQGGNRMGPPPQGGNRMQYPPQGMSFPYQPHYPRRYPVAGSPHNNDHTLRQCQPGQPCHQGTQQENSLVK
ncbi:MAG: hypothetical protein AB7I18_01665 [Candidatus Berkiella sp.]